MRRLTDRNKKFIEFYLQTDNASQSFIDAGYGKNTKNVHVAAYNLLQKPEIKEEIRRRKAAVLTQFNVTAENVLHAYACIAFFDPRKLYNADGSMKDILALDEDTAKGVDVIEETFKKGGDRVIKIKPHPKIQALDVLAKHLGVITSSGVNITQANAEKGGVILIPQIENMEQWQQVVVSGENYKNEKRQDFEKMLEIEPTKKEEDDNIEE